MEVCTVHEEAFILATNIKEYVQYCICACILICTRSFKKILKYKNAKQDFSTTVAMSCYAHWKLEDLVKTKVMNWFLNYESS